MTRTRFSCGCLALAVVVACEQPGMNPSLAPSPKEASGGAAGGLPRAGSAGEVANAGAAGAPFSGVPLGRSSWDVRLSGVPEANSFAPDLGCETLPQTLVLEPSSIGLHAVLGTYGGFSTPGNRVPFGSSSAYGTFSAAELSPSKLGYQTRSLDITCDVMPVHLSEFSLVGIDADGDGVAERIEGSGSGHATYAHDDYVSSFDIEFALSGTPDQTPPHVFLSPNPGETNPFDALQVDASEPLNPETRVRLLGSTEIAFVPAASPEDTNTVFKSEVIRPFSGSWTLSVDGHDRAGLAVSSTIIHSTESDPGILAIDGFEGDPPLQFAGNSRVLDTINDLPALNGARSLFVYPASVVTLHLARPAGANRVRFSARLLSNIPGPNVLPIVAGVIGGVERVYPREFPHAFEDTGSTFLRYVAPAEEVELILTEAGEDVALRIAPPTQDCLPGVTPCLGHPGVMLDDLRIE